MMRAAIALLALAGASAPAPTAPFTYRFDEVKSKVLKAPGGDEEREVRVAVGDAAAPSDVVRTGMWGRTVLSVPERASRFEVESGTRVRLASDEPGVLLVVEKGRLKAFFEKLEGEPVERRVSAPGALLAVRGTRYGIEVSGDTTLLAVFEGTVEVIPSAAGAAPLFVNADELCTFGPRETPRREPMRMRGMSEGSWGMRRGERPEGMPGRGGMGSPGGTGGQPGGMGGSPQPGGGMGGGMGSGGGMGGGRNGGH